MKSLRKAIRELLYLPINFFTKLRLRSKIKSTSNKLQIIIGAHNTNYENWLPTNIDSLNLLEIDSFQHLFGDKKASRFLAEHVFEHISYSDALKNCYSYLEKGGAVRIAVPDGFHPNPEYINMVKPGGFGEGAHDHKLLYDYHTLSKVFEEAGFKANLLEYYDENGTFHYNDWDSKDGHVIRSKRYDKRFNEPLGYSSLIVDGIKE
jgi:predicted SAM-dependent methyltransferase